MTLGLVACISLDTTLIQTPIILQRVYPRDLGCSQASSNANLGLSRRLMRTTREEGFPPAPDPDSATSNMTQRSYLHATKQKQNRHTNRTPILPWAYFHTSPVQSLQAVPVRLEKDEPGLCLIITAEEKILDLLANNSPKTLFLGSIARITARELKERIGERAGRRQWQTPLP